MERKDEFFLELLRGNGFFPTKAIKQHWQNRRYSYLDTPRPDHGFLLVTHGEMSFSSARQTISAKTGDLIFLPKGSYYEAIIETESEDYLVNFDTRDNGFSSVFPIKLLENAPLFCHNDFMLLTDAQLFPETSSLKSKALFYSLADHLIIAAFTKQEDGLLEQVQVLLQKDENIPIPEIAARCNISESGLRKKFKEKAGVSLSRYRLDFKIAKAKYLLESTDLSISAIADRLHFFDEAYFCRTFKHHIGLSPNQYRKSRQI